MSAELKIRKATEQDLERWDSYVNNHAQGSFFHLSGWLHIFTNVFKRKPHYMLATQGNEIVAILPLVEQKSWLFGHALISTPFCVYGGVIADTDEIRHEMENAAYELGKELNVDYVELRDREEKDHRDPWIANCHHSTFSCQLEDSEEAILTSVKRKQRAVIRHSLNNNLLADNSDNIDVCYNVYAESVRNLGTPVFSKNLFVELKNVFGSRCETLVINNEQGEAVSSVLSFYYKNEVLPYYGGGIHEARALKSNDFMYYKLMCLAREQGINKFDFGRSKNDSGSYKYKKNWGMSEEKLHYYIALVKSTELPNLSPNNPKYKFFIETWQKLPLSLSRIIGPYLSKYLG